MKNSLKGILLFVVLFTMFNVKLTAQVWFNADTVKSSNFDIGKMWTFEYLSKDYFKTKYNFNVTDEWLESARLSALRFATYCSASFVSGDGLVMTNDHCSRDNITKVSKPGEDLQKTSFFAKTLAEERKVPDLFVDQLIKVIDVTAEIEAAIKDKPQDQQSSVIADMKKQIENREKVKNSADAAQVVTLYNGGKYSLYLYKRYDDVRLVFSPETDIAFYGGDPDNFTYPRYDYDCTFYRVYDKDGKPLKTKNFYKWSKDGAAENELTFVIGNPGHTDRLQTTAQLEFLRDVQYPRTLELIDQLMKGLNEQIASNPPNKEDLQNEYFGLSNSFKAISGQLKGLRDPYLFARKVDFEKRFRDAINSKPETKALYGDLWDKIAKSRQELKSFANESFALGVKNKMIVGEYMGLAAQLVDLSKLSADEFKDRAAALYPAELEAKLEKTKLANLVDRIRLYAGADNPAVKEFTNNLSGNAAANDILSRSSLSTKEGFEKLISGGPDAIKNSNDPFIKFVNATAQRRTELQKKSAEIGKMEVVYNQAIGKALYEVYGTNIPPDATFTLRISDGVVKGYEYNGTIAPAFTTFYGLYEKYNAFNKQYPFDLPKKWQNPDKSFNMATKYNFVATNDIIGGNSGSAMINKNQEVVGLVFDGNIESLPGDFIFMEDFNRTVAVHSSGLLEGIKNIYKATRLAKELETGKVVEK